MRFTNNRIVLRLLNFCFAVSVLCNCALSVACQSKDEKIVSALKRCQEFLDKDNVEEAGNCYQQLIKANPSEAKQVSKAGEDAVFKKCLEFKDEKDFKNSIICLEGILGLRSDSAVIYFQLADSYFEYFEFGYKNNSGYDIEILSRAEDSVKNGLNINSNDSTAHALYGNILKYKGKKEDSLKELKIAVDLSPKSILFWIYLGIAQEKFREDESAIESYKQVLVIEPKNSLALYFLGKLYEKTGKADEAIEIYEKLLEIEGKYDDAGQRLKALKEKRGIEEPTKKIKSKVAGKVQ